MSRGMARPACWECVVKHLGKAAVLLAEVEDYPAHLALAVGNASEAEDECPDEEMRVQIRVARSIWFHGRCGYELAFELASEALRRMGNEERQDQVPREEGMD